MNHNFIAGIDIGVITTKIVIIDLKGKIISKQVIPTGTDIEDACERGLNLAVKEAQISRKNIVSMGITGRGRSSIRGDNYIISEVMALGSGAFYIDNRIRTVLDIGGYGSKVINIENDGNILKFRLNDKCASSTGSFLTKISAIFQLSLKEWIEKGLLSQSPVEITTTCAVFAESEVISKLAQGVPREDIIAGIHLSMIKRLTPTLKSVGIKKELMLSGGVAQNCLIVKMIENYLNIKPIIISDPQIIGAVGAAVVTLKNLNLEGKL